MYHCNKFTTPFRSVTKTAQHTAHEILSTRYAISFSGETSAKHSRLRTELPGVSQLRLWRIQTTNMKKYALYFTELLPSCGIKSLYNSYCWLYCTVSLAFFMISERCKLVNYLHSCTVIFFKMGNSDPELILPSLPATASNSIASNGAAYSCSREPWRSSVMLWRPCHFNLGFGIWKAAYRRRRVIHCTVTFMLLVHPESYSGATW